MLIGHTVQGTGIADRFKLMSTLSIHSGARLVGYISFGIDSSGRRKAYDGDTL